MKIRRRLFLAGLGGMGLGVGLGGLSHLFPLSSPRVGPAWRPGKEGFVPSTCLLCPSHCGILGRVVDGSLVSIDGNPLHPVSRGGICPKGKAGIQLLHHPGRLKGPMERVGAEGGFRPIPWEAALERVAGTLGRLRSEGKSRAVGYLVGEVGGTLGDLVRRFLRVYGSPNLLEESYGDGSEQVLALMQGREARPAFDLDRSSLVLSFGAPLSEAWWCLPQAAQARNSPPQERPRWVQVDTRLSRTAAACDQWLPVRPGSFGLLALGVAYVLIKEGLYDTEWIHEGLGGFEDWTDESGRRVPGYRSLVLSHGKTETVADRVGLPVEKIVRLAKEFGRAERPLAVWDQVASWRSGGLADALAIHSLNVLTGSLQRPGGVYVQPAPYTPTLDDLSPGTAGAAVASDADLQAAGWADGVLEGAKPPLEVIFLHQANPVASSPEPGKARRALERIPLVVSFSPFLDESARCADLVLPDHVYLERWQDGAAPASVPIPVWGVVQPMVEPLHDTRATGDVLLELAARIGGTMAEAFPWSGMEELIRRRGSALAEVRRGSFFVSAFRQAELRELAERGWWMPHHQSGATFWKNLKEAGGWFDPYHDDYGRSAASRLEGGRVALLSREARSRLGDDGMEEGGGFLPSGPEAETDEIHLLRLNPYRVMTLSSGSTALMPWLLENIGPLTSTAWSVWIEINPHTASRLGLTDGRKVRVVSAHGQFEGLLRYYEGAQPGVINVPYGLHTAVNGWGAMEPANPLTAIGDRRDPVTGLPDWYGTRVRIEML